MKKMLIKDFMTKDPITLNVDESLCRVAEIFEKNNIRHLDTYDQRYSKLFFPFHLRITYAFRVEVISSGRFTVDFITGSQVKV